MGWYRDNIILKVCEKHGRRKQVQKKSTLGVVNYMYVEIVENIA